MVTKTISVGGTALARETGLSTGTVSKHLRMGKSPDQIRKLAAARQAFLASTGVPPTGPHRSAYTLEGLKRTGQPGPTQPPAPAVPVQSSSSSYVPPRRVPVQAGEFKGGRTGVIGSPTPPVPAPSSTSLPEVTVPVPVIRPGYTYEDAVAEHQAAEDLVGAKLRRAVADADAQELANAQKRGELVPVAYIQTWGTRFLTQAKEELLKGPGELQDHLAGESNPGVCNGLVRGWVERVLEKMYRLEGLWGGGAGQVPVGGEKEKDADKVA
jgi:hypothetical protein